MSHLVSGIVPSKHSIDRTLSFGNDAEEKRFWRDRNILISRPVRGTITVCLRYRYSPVAGPDERIDGKLACYWINAQGPANGPGIKSSDLPGAYTYRPDEIAECVERLQRDWGPGLHVQDNNAPTDEGRRLWSMSTEELRELGEAMFGSQWVSETAHALGISVRHMQRLAAGKANITPGIASDLHGLAGYRIRQLRRAMKQHQTENE